MFDRLKNPSDKDYWTLAVFSYIGLWGLAVQLRGPLLKDIQETFSVSTSLLGLVAPAGTVGYAVTAFSMGVFSGRIDLKKFILVGTVLTALTAFLVGLSPVYPVLLGGLVFLGLAAGIPGGLCRPLIPHFYPENRGKAISIYESIWAVGATCGPLLATLILYLSGWRSAYLLLGFLFIPTIILMFRTDFPHEVVHEKPLTVSKFGELIKDPKVLGILIALFLNVGVEGGIFTWLPYFLAETLSFPQNIANLALSGCLAAYIPGRLVNSKLSEKFEYTSLLITDSLIAAFLLVLAFYFETSYVTILLVILVAFFISAAFPNLYSLSVETYPRHSGPMNGLFMTFDPMGVAVIPAIMGFVGGYYNTMQAGMKILVFPIIAVAAIAIFLKRR